MPKNLERKLTMATMEATALPVTEHVPNGATRGPNGYQIFFNSCPRCSGTRHLDRDQFGWYVSCVACGYAAYPLIKQRGRPRAHVPDDADPPRRARRISLQLPPPSLTSSGGRPARLRLLFRLRCGHSAP
jgi:hypothetical protein